MTQPEETEAGLVMPFVTVASKGGPHDDQAYVAGYEMGILQACLEAAGPWVTTCHFTIHAENRAQADLIAMRFGFTITESDDRSEWAYVTLSRRGVS